MKLSHSFSSALRKFSYWMANGTVGYPLLKDIEYTQIMIQEPSLMEQAYAIFANNIEMDKDGNVLNGKYAEQRAAEYIRRYCDKSYVPKAPFEDWELFLY